MSALSAIAAVENPNKVWMRVKETLAGGSPLAQQSFKNLKAYLATQKGNPNLRFSLLKPNATDGLVTASDGQAIGAGAATVYGVYVRALVGGSAPTYTILFDDGTDDNLSGLTAAVTVTIPSLARSTAAVPADSWFIDAKGMAFANGIRAASVTAPQGLTIDAAADSVVGFIISA